MVMDPGMELSGLIDEFRFGDELTSQNTMNNSFKLQGTDNSYFSNNYNNNQHGSFPYASSGNYDILSRNSGSLSLHLPDAGQGEESVFSEVESDITLKYISRMLLEEDMDDKGYTPQVDSALLAAEKPFLEILGENYHPPSPNHYLVDLGSPRNSISNNRSCVTGLADGGQAFDFGNPQGTSEIYTSLFDHPSPSSFSSSNSNGHILDGMEEHQSNTGQAVDLLFGSNLAWQFNRGVAEANKFLPDHNKLIINLESGGGQFLSHQCLDEEHKLVKVKIEKVRGHAAGNEMRGRKNLYHEYILDLEEGRSTKQSAVSSSSEEPLRSDLFDEVLLCNVEGKCKDAISTLGEALKIEVSKNAKNSTSKGLSGGKRKGKKHVKKEVVDLRTLLIHCAQSVAADDRRNANELLKQIRQHSNLVGDGSQRLAQVFADGLEARLAGTGSQIYHSLMAKRQSATDILKAYKLYLAACPFKKISHFFANLTIVKATEKATSLHVIDFGIYFGFQWPCLIQRLALRPGGPPKLRITGIDVPQPGFRPNERIEETGRRLAEYAKDFNVPFEYNSIASKWENIQIEDLKINKNEVLVVNCLYRFRNLVDETVVVDSPRDVVLNNIKKMNPDVFIHGVMNGSYSAPFFVTRFREALFHFSSMFDMLDTTVPREHPERLLIEREIFGREAMNVIACEGSERVERPETYKQWQVRNLRAGFTQLPLDHDIMKQARERVKGCYNKDFVIDTDGKWLLQGWKGRIMYTLSTWKPVIRSS